METATLTVTIRPEAAAFYAARGLPLVEQPPTDWTDTLDDLENIAAALAILANPGAHWPAVVECARAVVGVPVLGYVGPILTETDDEYGARVSAASRHGRHCAGRCITRAYALATLGIAAVVALHVALGW